MGVVSLEIYQVITKSSRDGILVRYSPLSSIMHLVMYIELPVNMYIILDYVYCLTILSTGTAEMSLVLESQHTHNMNMY